LCCCTLLVDWRISEFFLSAVMRSCWFRVSVRRALWVGWSEMNLKIKGSVLLFAWTFPPCFRDTDPLPSDDTL
jgi:hypothetical protein